MEEFEFRQYYRDPWKFIRELTSSEEWREMQRVIEESRRRRDEMIRAMWGEPEVRVVWWKPWTWFRKRRLEW